MSKSFSKLVVENSESNIKSSAPLSNKVYSTGRRKTSVARVWVSYGNGKITVNKMLVDKCFEQRDIVHILEPLKVTDSLGKFDIWCTVKGGGTSGQAGAIKHGVARSLDKINPDLHLKLKQAGCLTRDSREVERKKFGQHKARKHTQFSKR